VTGDGGKMAAVTLTARTTRENFLRARSGIFSQSSSSSLFHLHGLVS
jgi:hypothetical protein